MKAILITQERYTNAVWSLNMNKNHRVEGVQPAFVTGRHVPVSAVFTPTMEVKI